MASTPNAAENGSPQPSSPAILNGDGGEPASSKKRKMEEPDTTTNDHHEQHSPKRIKTSPSSPPTPSPPQSPEPQHQPEQASVASSASSSSSTSLTLIDVTPALQNQMYNLMCNPKFEKEKAAFRQAIVGYIGLNGAPGCQQKLMDFLEQLIKNEGEHNDAVIYEKTRNYVHEVLYNSQEWIDLKRRLSSSSSSTHHSNSASTNHRFSSSSKSDSRAWHRVQDIDRLISRQMRHLIPMQSYLDVGCSEGAITVHLGDYLVQKASLPATQIHGCDVVPIKETESRQFDFTLIKEDSDDPHKLPYASSSQSVVSAMMMLHHVKSPQDMLQEMKRVLLSGGLLIVREHDCTGGEFSVLLDIMHAFYVLVWPQVKESPSFTDFFPFIGPKKNGAK